MNSTELARALQAYGSRELKIQVGKRVYKVGGLLPVDPTSPADAYLSVEKIKKVRSPKEVQVINVTLTVNVEVEKVTKKEKAALLAAGVADNDNTALAAAKAKLFLEKAKKRGCKLVSVK